LKVDFHFHASLTKNIPFDHDFFSQTVARAREQGMFAITVTDHFDSNQYANIFPALDERYEYNGHYYLIEDVRFYLGMEVEVKEGPHLLVSGIRENVMTFYERLRLHLTPETYVTVPEFFEKQDGLDLMNIFAHPFRPKREFARIDPTLASRFDAFDINAKDLWRYGMDMRGQVEALGAEYSRPVVAGSDTHHFLQLGSVYNEFQQPFETIAELRARIHEGAYTAHVRPELPQWVEIAQSTKKAVKESKYGIKSSKFD
jgi:histidinol phosphatase-like PHP family hydrolase